MTLQDKFDFDLDEAISWRELELSNLKLQIQSSISHMEKRFLLRGGWALLYAHWEGSIKELLVVYKDFINSLFVSNKFLFNKNSCFVLYLLLLKNHEQIAFKNIICHIKTLDKMLKDKVIDFNIYKNTLIQELKVLLLHRDIKQNAKNELQEFINMIEANNPINKLEISKNVVNTESNLGFDVLRKLFSRFDIQIDSKLELESQRINQILKYRNDIAHGDKHHFFSSSETQQLDKQLQYLQDCIDKIIFIIKQSTEQLKLKKEELCPMKKLWSISTTVRNPERLRNFLIALKDLEGQIWDNATQKAFQINLIKYRFYGFGSTQFYDGLTQEQIDKVKDINYQLTFDEAQDIFNTKNYEDSAMRGRNSFKALEKMGVAFIVDDKITITSLGEYLLSDNYDLGEFFFKSFIKWQYPNPESRDFSNRSVYDIKPFIAILHLINDVNKLCEERNLRMKGISKQEFMIFGQSLLHHQNIRFQAQKLVEFRTTLESIQNNDEKKEYVDHYVADFFSEFDNATDGNLHDYADNTIRYFRLTRYITVRGGGFYIDLEPRRMIEIQKLLATDNASAREFTRDEYITYMSDINQPILPWEEKNELLAIYNTTISDIHRLENILNLTTKEFILNNQEIQYLKDEIERLRTYRHKLLNVQLRKETSEIQKIEDTVNALSNIRKLDIKASIALEKYITYALNIINDAKEIKANSILSDDNDFIFTAPANKPDIECFYNSFNSVCEVTMLTNRDQWHNEGQPVMRHFRDFERTSNHQNNYCIFVAPSMHRDTINTFWMSVKYEYEGSPQRIIPLSISQIIQILQTIKELKLQNKSFSHLKFKQFLDGIIGLKNTVTSSDEWLRAIPTILNNFKQELLCS
jgi:hypothetical protein